MDRPGVQQVPEGGGEQAKMEKTGCKIICGAPTTLAVKGLMMMMSVHKCLRVRVTQQVILDAVQADLSLHLEMQRAEKLFARSGLTFSDCFVIQSRGEREEKKGEQ